MGLGSRAWAKGFTTMLMNIVFHVGVLMIHYTPYCSLVYLKCMNKAKQTGQNGIANGAA